MGFIRFCEFVGLFFLVSYVASWVNILGLKLEDNGRDNTLLSKVVAVLGVILYLLSLPVSLSRFLVFHIKSERLVKNALSEERAKAKLYSPSPKIYDRYSPDDPEIDAIRAAAFKAGEDHGVELGKSFGRMEGSYEGYTNGYEAGCKDGEIKGYDRGFIDGRKKEMEFSLTSPSETQAAYKFVSHYASRMNMTVPQYLEWAKTQQMPKDEAKK